MRALFVIVVHATSVAAFSSILGLQRARGIVRLNAVSDEAVAAYRAKFNKPKQVPVPDEDLKVTFKTIAGLYGGDDNALKMVSVAK